MENKLRRQEFINEGGWRPICTIPFGHTVETIIICVTGKTTAQEVAAKMGEDYKLTTIQGDACCPPTHWRPF